MAMLAVADDLHINGRPLIDSPHPTIPERTVFLLTLPELSLIIGYARLFYRRCDNIPIHGLSGVNDA